jgi:hypothetical protein
LLTSSKDAEEKKFLQKEINSLEERLRLAEQLLEQYDSYFAG